MSSGPLPLGYDERVDAPHRHDRQAPRPASGPPPVKVPAPTLPRLLAGTSPPLAYLLVGSEVPRVLDGAELVRAHFRAHGIVERELAVADRGFDWEAWLAARANGSLFAAARLSEVRLLESGAPLGRLAPRLLASVTEASPLVVTAFSLEKTFRTSAFYRHWEEAGHAVVVEIWPLRPREWTAYVARAARDLPRPLSPEALALLTRASEDNVQALRDALGRLRLLTAPGTEPLSREEVVTLLDDEPRLGAFDFVEAVLAGDLRTALRRLAVLERLGTEPLLVLGALTHRLRAEFLPTGPRPPPGRRGLVSSAGDPARRWRDLVRLDRAFKTGRGLPPWRALENLVRAWLPPPGRSGV